MTREEVVKYLQDRHPNWVVKVRDWAMGQTIMIATDGEQVGELVCYKHLVYLYPEAGGRWTVEGPNIVAGVPLEEDHFTLEEACAEAERRLA